MTSLPRSNRVDQLAPKAADARRPHRAGRYALVLATLLGAIFAPKTLTAARVVPDPAITEQEVRDFVARRTAAGSSLGALKLNIRRQSPLDLAINCEAVVVLGESLYVEVPRSDNVFAPVREAAALLEETEALLKFVPREFVASLGGRQYASDLSLLNRTLVRTSVPKGSAASVEGRVNARHDGRWFGGVWTLEGPSFQPHDWRGEPLAGYSLALAVDSPDFSREIAAFLDGARRVREEVFEICARYIVQVDADRSALMATVEPGSVFEIAHAETDGRSLFLETKRADLSSRSVDFALGSAYAPAIPTGPHLAASLVDPAEELRARLREQRAAPKAVAEARAAAAPEDSRPKATSLGDFLRTARSMELVWNEGQPVLRRADLPRPVPLAMVPGNTVREERARVAQEALSVSDFFSGKVVLRGVLVGRNTVIGTTGREPDGRLRLTIQFDEEGNDRVAAVAEQIERDGKVSLQARQVSGNRAAWEGAVLALSREARGEWRISAGADASTFHPTEQLRVLSNGRIVAAERAKVLEFMGGRRPGLYVTVGGRMILIYQSAAPLLVSAEGSSLRIPADGWRFDVKAGETYYASKLVGSLHWLPVMQQGGNFTFAAVRLPRGGFAPRPEDLRVVPLRQIDDGLHEFSLEGVTPGEVGALVVMSDEGPKYHLVRVIQ